MATPPIQATTAGLPRVLILALALIPTGLAILSRSSRAGTGVLGEEDARAFDDPSGLLPKVILTRPSALFDSIDGASVPVDAFSRFFWLKQDGRAITAAKGAGWIRVGYAPNRPVGWLKNRDIIPWRTRALLMPVPPADRDTRFTVTLPNGDVANFNGGDDRLHVALVLAPPPDRSHPVYEVSVFNAPIPEAVGKKVNDVGTAVIAGEDAKAAGPTTQSLYMALKADGSPMDLPLGTMITGKARVRNDRGREVAIAKILVTRSEVKKLSSTLDFLCSQFEDLVEPDKRKDVSELLDALRRETAAIQAGQPITNIERPALDRLIAALPFHNGALDLTAPDIARMSRPDYQQWLQRLLRARNDAAALYQHGDWIPLAMGKSQSMERFGFLRPEELP